MSDFLDRYGAQLRAAQHEDVSAVGRAVRRLRGMRRRRALALGAVAALAVAGPAAAIVAPWQPSLSRAGLDEPVATSSAPLDADVSRWLAVLRRPQTAQDRVASAPLLQVVGAGDLADGVQTAGIRALGGGWALVPVTSVKAPAGDGPGLCLANGEQLACGQAEMVNRIGMSGASASRTHTEHFGLVPDGVRRVRFIPAGGDPVSVAVDSNFFLLRVAGSSSAGSVTPPAGYTGPAIAPPPMPVAGRIEWLDQAGAVVGPGRR